MRFSVIYSFNVPKDRPVEPYLPSQIELFTETEGV
jgi:hypothetical protein